MHIRPVNFQTNYFWEGGDISPTAEVISKALTKVKSKPFLPSTIREMMGGQVIDNVPRLRLVTADSQWITSLLSKTLVVDHIANVNESFSDQLVSFAAESAVIAQAVLEVFPKRSNRLSLLSKIIVHGLEPQKLSDAGSKFVVSTDFFRQLDINEWQWKQVGIGTWKNGDTDESTNLICQVSRIAGEIEENGSISEFEGVQIDIDINTRQTNLEFRFSSGDIDSFYPYALDKHNQIASEMIALIQG